MWFINKKIRELNRYLEGDSLAEKKMPKELKEVVNAIEATSPAAANPAFTKNLRQQLLLKHKSISTNPASMKISSKKPSKKESSDSNWFNKFNWNFPAWKYATALLLVIVVGSVVSYPFIPAPEVQGYTLREGVRLISYNAPIKISFSQLMDHGSVEKSFTIAPEVSGKFEWSANTMAFVPNEQFKPGQEYKVSVSRSAKSLLQKEMRYDYIENFEITGSPQVTLFNPANESSSIPTDAHITVMFDRPMTALQSLDEGETRMPAIEITPQPKGRFKWLGTNAVMFIPEKLAYATEYTVKVPAGTESAEGGKTDADFVTKFTTVKPALISASPYHGYNFNGVDTKIKLDFNQPMNVGKVDDFINVYKYEGNNPEKYRGVAQYDLNPDMADWKEIPYRAHYKNEAEWKEEQYFTDENMTAPDKSELDKTIVLEVDGKLKLQSMYMVILDEGFLPAEGSFNLEEGTKFIFETVSDLTVKLTSPANGSDLAKVTDKYNRNIYNAEIYFSHPIEPADVEKFVEISPMTVDKDTDEKIEPSVSVYEDDTTLAVRYSFKPSTEYTIKVKAGLKDKFNQTLANDYSFSFKTAPRESSFELRSGTDISVLDASLSSIFYLKTVNLDYTDMNLKKLTDDEFLSVYSRGYVSFYETSIGGPFVSWKQNVESVFNDDVITKLDLDKINGSKLTPGAYYMDLSNPAVRDWNGNIVIERHVFVVTNTGLATKRSADELMVWATSMKDGAPISNYEFKIFSEGRKEVGTGKTDSSGLATVKLPTETIDIYQDLTVKGTNENDYAMTNTSWSEGVAPWDFNIESSLMRNDYYIYAYTDRPIYRPGHDVYFKGLVRVDADADFSLPKDKKVHVVIEDPRGEKIFEKDLSMKANGTFTDKLTLGNTARTGSYTLAMSVVNSDGTPITSNYSYGDAYYHTFRIAEYRKPDYELNLVSDKDDYVNGDKAKIKVRGQYFFGAPMPEAAIEWTVKSQDYYFFLNNDSESPFASQWFSFSDEGYFCYWGCEGESTVVSEGKAKLDENGEYVIELPLDISEKKLSQIYTVEVTAFDLNNQSVSNRVLVPVHEGEYYVGIMNDDYVVGPGESANFEIVTVDYDGMPLGGKKVDVQLLKREWNTVKKKNVDGGYYYENSYNDQLVETKTVTTNAEGKAVTDFAPKDGGSFKVMAISKDGRGNEVKASTTLYAYTDSFVNWGRENNDKIELVPDKLEYKPGETANILIKSPYQNVWALVTQERGGILDKEVIKIESNSQTVSVPITEKSIPNVFVSVILVKGNSNAAGLVEPPAGEGDERSYAAFKAGYATLQVDNSSKELLIDIQTDNAKYAPRDNVTVKVKTTDSSGKPVSADLSLSVVDKSVLSLTENVTADLLNTFYRKRLLGVLSSHTLTKAISRVNVLVEAGMKGGGGGVIAKRGLFKDTAHFEASLRTDESGYGELLFSLPDNLTTWEILAIGITDDTLVGSKKGEFLVTKDVLIRPVLPRFLTQNDGLSAGVIVHNYLDKAETFKVTLAATGVTVDGATTQNIVLAAGEEKKIEWQVRVKNEQTAVFDITAQTVSDSSVGDRLEQTLPIYPYSFPEIVSTSVTFDDNAKHIEKVWLPMGIDENYGKLTVSASPTLTASISQGLEYLMRFPYGCAEQTASALLPNLVLKRLMDLPVVNDDLVDPEELDDYIDTGIATLIKYQKSNGGWGIWESSSPTPYLTSYILFTLNEAKKAGISVDKDVLDRGKKYLRQYMENRPLYKLNKQPLLNDQLTSIRTSDQRMDANGRAFGLFVLSEMGDTDTALSVALFDYKDDLNTFAKAYLVMVYDNILLAGNGGSFESELSGKIKTLKDEIMNTAKETPRGVHFEEKEHLYYLFDTDTRTTAIVLQMLSRVEPSHPFIPKIVRNLLMEKKGGHFASTQETAMALLGLMEYLKNSGELEADYKLNVAVNGTEKINKDFDQSNISDQEVFEMALTELLADNQDNEIVFSKSGNGKVYGDVNLEYYLPTEQVKPRDEGLLVSHEYFAVSDEKMEKPIKQIKVGENVKVKVTIVVPEDRYYVMMEDYLPAGLEGIDFNLATSQQSLQDDESGEYGMWDAKGGYYGGKGGYIGEYWNEWGWYFNYSEVKDDRVMYFADMLPSGVYEIEYFVRATTPGVFHDKPALAQELYFPEVFGRSQGDMFTVTE